MTEASTPPVVADRSGLAGQAAQRLEAAARTCVPRAPIRDLTGTSDAELAHAAQQRRTEARSAGGARIAGRKIGLTSPTVQLHL